MIIPNEFMSIKNSMSYVGSELHSSVNTPVQYACLDLFNNFNQITPYLTKSNNCLRILSNEINKIFDKTKIKYIKPKGGFYYFIDMSEYSEKLKKNNLNNCVDLCNKILNDTGIAILAGYYFGIPENRLTARLSFVDFDGEIIINNNLTNADILEVCSNTIEGCKKLAYYLENL